MKVVYEKAVGSIVNTVVMFKLQTRGSCEQEAEFDKVGNVECFSVKLFVSYIIISGSRFSEQV